MHEVVTSDWFLLLTGLCSVVGFGLSIFAVSKVIEIDNSMKINSQNITAINNSKEEFKSKILGWNN